MKLTTFLLVFACLQVSASGAAQLVTLNEKNVSIAKIFEDIRRQTGFEFIASMHIIETTPPVTIRVKNVEVSEALNACFKSLSLTYEIDGRTIIISQKTAVTRSLPVFYAAPPIDVHGRILNEKGEPVIATILVKGTSTGTTSDADGYFDLKGIDDRSVLVITATNISRREWPLVGANTSNLAITVTTASNPLDEVVIIGYGEKSRKLLTESISTVSATDIKKLPVASPDAAIQGRVSGVQITNVDGTPGSPVSIRIRGIGTTGNAQPLFIIDGVQVGNNGGYSTNPLASINPSDIDNISVLKDASATAVYGMRAANGVVLITTKRGKSGKPNITLDAYYGIQKFPKKLAVNNTDQYLKLAQEAVDNRNAQLGVTAGNPDFLVLNPQLIAGTPGSVVGINTDWQTPTIVKNAPVTNYNMGLSGGTPNSNYFFSAGYFKQEAVVRKWDLERYNVRINSDYKIGTRLKVGQTLTISYQNVSRGINGGGDGFLFANNASMPPFFKIYDDNNSIPGNRYGFNGNLGTAGFTIGNQFGINEIVDRQDKNYRLLGGIYAELEIIKGLKYKSAASLDFGYARTTEWQPGYTALEIGLDRSQNLFGDSRSENYNQVFTNTLTYDKSIGRHQFNVLAGIEYQKIRGNNLGYGGQDFQSTNPNFYQSVRNGRGNPQQVNGGPYRAFANAGSGLYNQAFVGYIGRVSYNYEDKYLVTASIRRDGTSRFAKSNRFGNFPAVSAAWRVSEESFFPSGGIVSDLKLRGSWGQAGNANTSDFAFVPTVTFTPDYGIGGVAAQAPSQAFLPNPDIGWETVEISDFGFDVSFFNNKVNLLATYYIKNTRDFLVSLPIPFTSGFGGSDVNVGNVKNSGIELDLSYKTVVGKNFNIEIGGNFTTVKNRLTSLAAGVNEFNSDGIYRTGVGYPIGYYYGYKATGVYQNTTQTATALPDNVSGVTPRPGDIIFQDNNGPAKDGAPAGTQFSGEPDGQITPEDRTYLGKSIPDFMYGLSLAGSYRQFDLSVLFQGVGGIQIYNQFRADNEGLGGAARNQLTVSNNRWKGEGTSNDVPRTIVGDPYKNTRFNSRYIEDAGFLRFKNIQLGYTIAPQMLQRLKAFKSARVYLAATNLFRITKYTGLDPEVVTYGRNTDQIAAGTDQASIPQPITIQGGIQVSF